MPRERLPGRRPSLTQVLAFEDILCSVTVGFYPDGRPGEIFADGPKVGSALEAEIDDACILISRLLQLGERPAALAASLGREGATPDQPAASLIGVFARHLAGLDAENANGVRVAAEEGP